MKITNPIKINDWNNRRSLILILCLQVAITGLIILDQLGFHVPFLRTILGVIYLIIVPGMLILKILRIHELETINTLLYSIGLSLTLLMFVGLFITFLYPIIGIKKPISTIFLLIALNSIIFILLIMGYIRDKDFCGLPYINVKTYFNLYTLGLCIIPLLAIFAAYLVNYYGSNLLMLILLFIIALVFFILANKKSIPDYVYPFAILMLSISLLLHNSLISNYIWGWDIHLEYHLANSVINSGFWDHSKFIPSNGMLSIVMLMPIFSLICDIDLTWVLKLLYPMLFSLAALGLFQVFKKLTDEKIAFLSTFFFISFTSFYFEMLTLPRQQLAEFFLALLILLILDKSINMLVKSLLSICYGASLIVSHYSITYIYLFSIICTWLLLVLFKNIFGYFKNLEFDEDDKKYNVFNLTFIIFFFSFAISWYIYVSESSAINPIIFLAYQITFNFFGELLNPESSAGLRTIVSGGTISILHLLAKYLHILALMFMSFGIVLPLINSPNGFEFKMRRAYYLQSITFYILAFFSIIVPYFLAFFSTSRMYQITLIFLAPFCIIGGTTFLKIFGSYLKLDVFTRLRMNIISVFLIILYLFNVGIIFELANDHPTSISLSQNNLRNSESSIDRASIFDCINVFEQDILASSWLYRSIKNSEKHTILADSISRRILTSYGSFDPERLHPFLLNSTKMQSGSIIFLGYVNLIENISIRYSCNFINTSDFYPLLSSVNEVYSSGSNGIFIV